METINCRTNSIEPIWYHRRNQTIPLAGFENTKSKIFAVNHSWEKWCKMEEMSHRLQSQSINQCVQGNLWQ